MSVTGTNSVGIPTILLFDCEGSIVTIELKNGTVLHGLLEEVQDSMNCTLSNVTKIKTNGSEKFISSMYVRGNNILYFVLPSIFKDAPSLDRIETWKKYKGHPPVIALK